MSLFRRLLIARGIRKALHQGGRHRIQRDREAREAGFDAEFVPLSRFRGIADITETHEYFVARPAPPSTTLANLPPGRQAIAMPGDGSGPFGMSIRPWSPPIPHGASSALWEDLHTFAPGGKPKRDPHYGLIGGDPPLAMICVGCELEQTPLGQGERKCPYCGINLKAHGTRVFWWRVPVDVAEWKL